MSAAAVDASGVTTLANDAMEIVVSDLGAQIRSLRSRATGREWLWTNPYLAPRTPQDSPQSFGDHDTGGWDEIFPSVNPCVVPGSSWQGRIADHGELWHRTWSRVKATTAAADNHSITHEVEVAEGRVHFQRRLTLASGLAPLVVDYALTNRSDAPLPYLWAAHPLIALAPGMTLVVPAGTRCRVATAVGISVDDDANEFAWPFVRFASGETVDVSCAPARNFPFAAKIFTSRLAEGRVSVRSEGRDETLTLSFDVDAAPYVGLWLNYGAWTGTNSPPYFNCGVEPTTSPHDDLGEAIQAGNAMLASPHQTLVWRLTLRLGA